MNYIIIMDPPPPEPTQYIKHFTELEKKAYSIAHQHLGTSFNIQKSNGYVAWQKKQPPSSR